MEYLNQSTVSSMADLIERPQDSEPVEASRVEVKIEPLHAKWNNEELDRQSSFTSQTSEVKVKAPLIAPKEWKLAVFLSVLFVVIVVGISLVYHFYIQMEYELDLGRRVHFDEIPRKLEVFNEDKDLILSGTLGMNLPEGMLPYDCFYNEDNPHININNSCVGWKDKAELTIDYNASSEHVNCYHFSWEIFDDAYYPYDCFDMGDAQWFGGILPYKEPFHEMNITERPFLTSTVNGLTSMSSVLDPYWLTTNSLALYVEGDPPLYLSVNERSGQMCLSSRYTNSPYLEHSISSLNYTICSGPSLKVTHEYVMKMRIGMISRNPPPMSLFSQPIYSTWAQFKDDIDQEKVIAYVQGLKNNSYNTGIVYLQEGWQSHHGDMKFDPDKFPDSPGMVDAIKGLGFDVGISFTHMVATDSVSFQSGVTQGVLVKDAGNTAPGLVQYWKGVHTPGYSGGFNAALDFSEDTDSNTSMIIIPTLQKSIHNAKATLFISHLDFEGGQTDLLPYHPNFKRAFMSPNLYTQAYDLFALSTIPWAPLQSAYKCQSCDIFIKLYDFNSTSDRVDNGLASVLPTVITLGLMGYPFITPGPIGGSNYATPPSKDLYIRWMQLATFLPVMHFSIPPHTYSSDVVSQAKELMALHSSLVVPEIEKVLGEANENLVPIVRPLWWFDDSDENCIQTTDQFMVGGKILVAPILSEGGRQRDIYLPKGTWVDGNDQKVYHGPRNIGNYLAMDGTKLIIPYFVLQD